MKMDDRLKKNPKNELLEDIRKIAKEEIEKSPVRPIYIPYNVFLILIIHLLHKKNY